MTLGTAGEGRTGNVGLYCGHVRGRVSRGSALHYAVTLGIRSWVSGTDRVHADAVMQGTKRGWHVLLPVTSATSCALV